ncbi:MAG: hypothetical protein ACJASP_002061 [Roseivirga sp.]|jgi:hypothetical protein
MVKHKIVEKKALQIYVMKNINITLIGNGFDRAHGLETSYKGFIHYLIKDILLNRQKFSEHESIIGFIPKIETESDLWSKIQNTSDLIGLIKGGELYIPKPQRPSTSANCNFKKSSSLISNIQPFLTKPEKSERRSFPNALISKCIDSFTEEKWSGIEESFYSLYLEACEYSANTANMLTNLNNGLEFIKSHLISYLKKETDNKKLTLKTDMIKMLGLNHREYEKQYFINYNYTPTLNQYLEHFDVDKKKAIHIHGSLENPEDIIFGYGSKDESVAQSIMNSNTNGLRNSKLLGVSSLRAIRDKLDKCKFDLNILGHSCSKSDGLSLSIFLNHKNLNSIRINARSEEEREALHKNLIDISQAESTRYFDREYKGTFNSKV